ncbi:hypothetical protein [Symbioplanes lichenis]|uniref:hypothetical protein n=1 Tax=Symbioplanes lichenis TaxID=1629072 RepID=UPI002739E8E9|nr:hypothetical protein [Actinoplanes lichenis]
MLALAVLLLRRRAAAPPAVRVLALAVTLFVLADVGYGYLQLHATFESGMWPDAAWLCGDYLLLLAAYRADRPAVAPRSSGCPTARSPSRTACSVFWLGTRTSIRSAA